MLSVMCVGMALGWSRKRYPDSLAVGGLKISLLCYDSLSSAPQNDVPHELNKISLETIGESKLDGILEGASNLVASWRLCPPSGGAQGAAAGQRRGKQRVALMSSTQSGPDAALNFWCVWLRGKGLQMTASTGSIMLFDGSEASLLSSSNLWLLFP